MTEDSLQLKKELLLWELRRLDAGHKLNHQQLWRARFLLATMSAAFLGACVTDNFNSGWPIYSLQIQFAMYETFLIESDQSQFRRMVLKKISGLSKLCQILIVG